MAEESKLQDQARYGSKQGSGDASILEAYLGLISRRFRKQRWALAAAGQRHDPAFTGMLFRCGNTSFWMPEACNLERTWNISPGVGSLIVFWIYLNVAPLIPNKPHSTPFHSRMPCQSLTGCPVKDSSFLLADSSFSWSRE